MKGVILAAGYGTRFLPGSKTIPKEMFPLIDTPAIDLIVREFAEAGIRDVLVVTSRRKKSLEDYFDREVELEALFADEGNADKQRQIEPAQLNFFFLRQQRMAGTADALLQVEPFVGNEPFVVAYPDDILLQGPSLSGQLMQLHRETGKIVLAAQELPKGDVSRYGVIDSHEQDGVELVRAMVEKPAPGTEPSRLVSYGRYVYTSEIFPALEKIRHHQAGSEEFTQTEVVNQLAEAGRVVVKRFEGRLIDVGTPQGYLHAIVEYGLYREEFREPLLDYLQAVLTREGRA
ncbi:MAG: UTP--glucose-1-phosphate uridylyltransferase [SAR324 cluster bacterium]|nr:UTP--glucose-1-phosphate uridylyltransferase [SAR324 cluster bacterium]MCZ6646906.1 UTP--glucose-1-phosphate uridylyltransferase [SAR324 cluster bacterium]